ncbi:MAG: TerC family protein, partial [Verrucomicrobiota bacterium]
NAWATFALLVGLELVLGIDNVLLISIVTGGLPEEVRSKGRIIGLSIALGARIAVLFGATALIRMTNPIWLDFSWKDLLLLAGGLFLIYKAVREIHHVVEDEGINDDAPSGKTTFVSAITQIVMLDIIFSFDSVITAVGLTPHLVIIIAAVLVSFVIVLFFATMVAKFVQDHPSIKILALAFLVVIGVTLFMEGFHQHVSKAFIYLPMGFALGVELLQMRRDSKRAKSKRTE